MGIGQSNNGVPSNIFSRVTPELSQIKAIAYQAGFAKNISEVFRLAQDAASFYMNNQKLTPVSYQGEVRDLRVPTTLKSNNFHFAKVGVDLLAELQNNPSNLAIFLLDKPINNGGDTWVSDLKNNLDDTFAGIPQNAPKEIKEALSKLPSNAKNRQAIEMLTQYAISNKDLSAYAALDGSVSNNIRSFMEFAERAIKTFTDIVTQTYEGIENLVKSIKFSQPSLP